MIKGKVKWFNDQKGFGFVEADGKDYFIHYKEINMQGFKSIKESDNVSFVADNSPKGLVARQLVIDS